MSEYTKGKLKALNSTIHDDNGLCIAEAFNRGSETPNPKANATELVRRWNAHEDLVTACEKALSLISEDLEYAGEPVRENNYKFLETALAEAKGKE